MKQILVDLDDALARDLERVAPAHARKRAEFIRLALRRAIDLAMDKDTARAYAANPVPGDAGASDLVGWDEQNALARPALPPKKKRAGTAA